MGFDFVLWRKRQNNLPIVFELWKMLDAFREIGERANVAIHCLPRLFRGTANEELQDAIRTVVFLIEDVDGFIDEGKLPCFSRRKDSRDNGIDPALCHADEEHARIPIERWLSLETDAESFRNTFRIMFCDDVHHILDSELFVLQKNRKYQSFHNECTSF